MQSSNVFLLTSFIGSRNVERLERINLLEQRLDLCQTRLLVLESIITSNNFLHKDQNSDVIEAPLQSYSGSILAGSMNFEGSLQRRASKTVPFSHMITNLPNSAPFVPPNDCVPEAYSSRNLMLTHGSDMPKDEAQTANIVTFYTKAERQTDGMFHYPLENSCHNQP